MSEHPGPVTEVRPPPAPVLDRAAFWLLFFLVIWAPIPLGSNRPWAWAILEVGIFTSGLFWLGAWARGENVVTPAARAAWPAFALLGAWLLLLLLHWLPLPAGLVQVLSPQSAALHAGANYLGTPGRWISLSVDPHSSFDFWLRSCAYATAFCLVLLLVHGRHRLAWLCFAFVATGLLQAFAGGVLHLGHVDLNVLGIPVQNAQQASGTYVGRNHLAGLLEMSLAVGVGMMIAQLEDRPGRSWRRFLRDTAELMISGKAVLRLALVIMVIALVMTRSRMGNTAFFASLLVAGGVALALSRRAPRSTVVFIASLIVVDLVLVGAWFGVERTMQRITETTATSAAGRADVVAGAWQMFRDFPVFGTGAGTFYTAFTRYRGEGVDAFYDHVHNDYLQFLAETGVLGAALVAALALASLGCAVLALARRHDRLARGVAFGVVMGVTAIGIHSAVDFNLQIPANAFLFVVLLALGWLSLHLRHHLPEPRPGGTVLPPPF